MSCLSRCLLYGANPACVLRRDGGRCRPRPVQSGTVSALLGLHQSGCTDVSRRPKGEVVSDPVSVGLAVVRIALGVIFLAHGVKHLMGREKTTRWFAAIGFKAPGFQWFASTATEIGAGVLLVVGLLTGAAAAGVIGIMFVAFWTVHRRAGFFITAFMRDDTDVEGYEYVALLAAVALDEVADDDEDQASTQGA